MKASLIQITNYAEQTITDIARVSSPANQGKDGTKLIQYLIRNAHWSPFEQAFATFEIETSLAVATQILRHRSFTFQQFSQRYSTSPCEFETVELRYQAETNRQSSSEVFTSADLEYGIRYLQETAVDLYNKMLQQGVAREVARMVLPQCTTTTLYVSGTIRSWLHYLGARLDAHTQKEHREVAEAIRDILYAYTPTICTAFFGAGKEATGASQ